MAAETRPLDVGASLRGESIFITGATGFIGKVLVEKLLWSVPELGKLLLLVRPAAARTAKQRLDEELLASPLFCRLRALHGAGWQRWTRTRIEVIAGDLARPRYGLSAEGWTALAERCDRVISCAATVAFDERLDRAIEVNVRGAQRALELAREAGGVPFLQVSTCFVSGRLEGSIPEQVAAAQLGADGELDTTLEALDEACRRARGGPSAAGRSGLGGAFPVDIAGARGGASAPNATGSPGKRPALVAAGAVQAARYGFHDAYTLTKAMAERLIARDRGSVPVAILRPAIVESAVAEPFPGWIESVRVTDPMLVAYGRGLGRDFPGAPTARLEIVPVDHVVNALIAALARLPASRSQRAPHPVPLRVYQLSSSRHPIELAQLVESARAGFTRAPLCDESGAARVVRQARFVAPRAYERRLRAALWRARGLARGAQWLGLERLRRRLLAAQRTLGHFHRLFEVYRPYFDHQASYLDEATRQLASSLSPADRKTFPFDVAAIDWHSYIADVHVPGLRRHALKSESGAPVPSPGEDRVAAAHARGEYPAAAASTLFGLLAAAATADPERVAFQVCRDGRWLRYTYREALTATANIAARLTASHGIAHGDRVVLWGSASPEWVLTSFAVHRLGAVTVPLDPQWPPAEVERAAALTEAGLICAAPELGRTLSASAPPVVELAAPFVPEPEVPLLPGAGAGEAAVYAADLASILFTSGTTVAPRAVPLTHDNILANVRSLVPVMRSSRERLLSVLPIHHVFELTVGLLVPLVGGGTISYLAELKPAEIRWMMNATQPTMLVAVPRLLELLHHGIEQSVAGGGLLLDLWFRLLFGLSAISGGRHGRRLFAKVHSRFGGSLRRIATGGSALRPWLGRRFQLMGFEVAEGYGMTETSPVLSVNPWEAVRFGSVGRPLAGVEVEIRAARAASGSQGPAVGEIWVRGANVMAGYYRNSEASQEALRDGWLHTGDLGYVDSDGYLHIAGRSKDVIVTSAGKNVYPEEVEERYRGLPGVEEIVVLGLADDGGGERVTAVVVPQPDATPEAIERLREAVAARSLEIPSYQRISRLEIWRGDLPKTTTLKVKRGRLREALLAGTLANGGATGPPAQIADPKGAAPTELREVLSPDQAWILSTVARLARARLESLDGSSRLSELGVDSLTRVELLAELEGRYGLRLDDERAATLARVQDLFDLIADDRAPAPAAGTSARLAS